MVQGLGLSAFTARAWVQSLVRKRISLKPHGTAKKKKKKRLGISIRKKKSVKNLAHSR